MTWFSEIKIYNNNNKKIPCLYGSPDLMRWPYPMVGRPTGSLYLIGKREKNRLGEKVCRWVREDIPASTLKHERQSQHEKSEAKGQKKGKRTQPSKDLMRLTPSWLRPRAQEPEMARRTRQDTKATEVFIVVCCKHWESGAMINETEPKEDGESMAECSS